MIIIPFIKGEWDTFMFYVSIWIKKGYPKIYSTLKHDQYFENLC